MRVDPARWVVDPVSENRVEPDVWPIRALPCPAGAFGSVRPSRACVTVRAQSEQQQAESTPTRREVLGLGAALAATTSLPLATGVSPALANTVLSAEWEQVTIHSHIEPGRVSSSGQDSSSICPCAPVDTSGQHSQSLIQHQALTSCALCTVP